MGKQHRNERILIFSLGKDASGFCMAKANQTKPNQNKPEFKKLET